MIQRIDKVSKARAVRENQSSSIDPWDRLWQASGDAMPLARKKCLQHYVEGFVERKRNVEVEILTASRKSGKVLEAALALVSNKRWKLFTEYRSPNNPWLQSGGLLTDKSVVTTRSFRELAAQIKALPCSFVTIDWADDSIEIQRLLDELKLAGCYSIRETQFETGILRLEGVNRDWESCFANLSKGFRKKLRSNLRKLDEIGEINFERHTQFESQYELDSLLTEAFVIEGSGWKGQAGTSLNANQEARMVFMNVMHELAADGMLEIQFLAVGGRRIAFEIGFRSHETYYSWKIGYHPDFAWYSPGQLLMYFQVQEWFATGDVSAIDTVGELSEASAKWCNETRTRYRFTIATRRSSTQLLRLSRWLKPKAKNLIKRLKQGLQRS